MRNVRRNGTTDSYSLNRQGEHYTRTINGYISDEIRAIEANNAGLSYDQLGARLCSCPRYHSEQTARLNYIGLRSTTWRTKTITTSP